MSPDFIKKPISCKINVLQAFEVKMSADLSGYNF